MNAPLRSPAASIPFPGPMRAPLADLLMTHRAQLMRVAQRILAAPHLAEEVVEDAALKLCEGEGALNVDHPLPFLFRLVRNLAIDRARRLKRERSLSGSGEEAARVAMPCASPLERLEHREMLHVVIRALQTLPPRTRFAFLRHRVDGMPQKDIAAYLGVSRTLVNFMVRDATKVCRESLDGYCKRSGAPCPLAPRPAGPRRKPAKALT